MDRDLLPEGEEMVRDLEGNGFQVLEVSDEAEWFRAVAQRPEGPVEPN